MPEMTGGEDTSVVAVDGIALPGEDGPLVGMPPVTEPEVGTVAGRDEANEELENGAEVPGPGVDDKDGADPDGAGPVVGIPSLVGPNVDSVTGSVVATDEPGYGTELSDVGVVDPGPLVGIPSVLEPVVGAIEGLVGIE